MSHFLNDHIMEAVQSRIYCLSSLLSLAQS